MKCKSGKESSDEANDGECKMGRHGGAGEGVKRVQPVFWKNQEDLVIS